MQIGGGRGRPQHLLGKKIERLRKGDHIRSSNRAISHSARPEIKDMENITLSFFETQNGLALGHLGRFAAG